jgi:hypothetical protein
MPGRSSGGRSSSKLSFSSKEPIKSSNPAPSASTPSVQHNVKVEQPGFFSNILQGFGLGTGQAIAHNIFRSDPVVKHVNVPSNTVTFTPEVQQPKAYVQCMKEYDNKDLCEQYLENRS